MHFRQKALKVILLYYLQIPDGAFIFSVAVKNISAHSVRNLYCFSAVSFNFLENNMLQSRITQTSVLKPCIFLKDGEFWKCSHSFWQIYLYCFIWQISWMSNWKLKTSFNNEQVTIIFNFLRSPSRVFLEDPGSTRWKKTQTTEYAKVIFTNYDWNNFTDHPSY